jgi:lysozyme family protein
MNAIDEILKHEGGFQNDKEDDGNYNAKGELVGTNHGIYGKRVV